MVSMYTMIQNLWGVFCVIINIRKMHPQGSLIFTQGLLTFTRKGAANINWLLLQLCSKYH